MQAQEPRQVRRRGIWRIELGHRRGDEQEAHGACSLAQPPPPSLTGPGTLARPTSAPDYVANGSPAPTGAVCSYLPVEEQ